jgi:hypothetical protein
LACLFERNLQNWYSNIFTVFLNLKEKTMKEGTLKWNKRSKRIVKR